MDVAALEALTSVYIFTVSLRGYHAPVMESLRDHPLVEGLISSRDLDVGLGAPTLLAEVSRYLAGYFDSLFLEQERFLILQLVSMTAVIRGHEVCVRPLVCLHVCGSSAVLFALEHPATTVPDIEEHVLLADSEMEFTATTASRDLVPNGRSTLRDLADAVLQRLGAAVPSLRQADSHAWQSFRCLFVDVSESDGGVHAFVDAHRDTLFWCLAGSHGWTGRRYIASRSEAYVAATMGQRHGSRRHATHLLSDRAVVAVASISHHPDIYHYSFRWWLPYATMTMLVGIQYQALLWLERGLAATETEPLHQLLHPVKVALVQGLAEYENIRVIPGSRRRAFIDDSKKAMGLPAIEESVRAKLDILLHIEDEQRAKRDQAANYRLNLALHILTVIMVYPVASTVVAAVLGGGSAAAPAAPTFALWGGLTLMYLLVLRILRFRDEGRLSTERWHASTSSDVQRRHYDRKYHESLYAFPRSWYSTRYWLVGRRIRRVMRDRGLDSPRVLDAGCGLADMGVLLTRYFPTMSYRGLDVSEEACQVVRRLGLEAECCDLDDAGNLRVLLQDGGYDLVLLHEVIEHLAHPAEALTALWDAIRPGGLMIFTTPNYGFVRFRDDRALHCQCYDRRRIRHLSQELQDHGLPRMSVRFTGGLVLAVVELVERLLLPVGCQSAESDSVRLSWYSGLWLALSGIVRALSALDTAVANALKWGYGFFVAIAKADATDNDND